jgi:hypothetical protein
MTIYPHYELTLYHTYITPTHTHMHAGIFVLTLACLVVESYLHTPVNFYALSLAYMTLNFFCILYVAFAGQPSIELEKLLRKCVCLCMSVCVYVMSNSGDVKMQIPPPHTHTHTHTYRRAVQAWRRRSRRRRHFQTPRLARSHTAQVATPYHRLHLVALCAASVRIHCPGLHVRFVCVCVYIYICVCVCASVYRYVCVG